jgi:hypothetical protein
VLGFHLVDEGSAIAELHEDVDVVGRLHPDFLDAQQVRVWLEL